MPAFQHFPRPGALLPGLVERRIAIALAHASRAQAHLTGNFAAAHVTKKPTLRYAICARTHLQVQSTAVGIFAGCRNGLDEFRTEQIKRTCHDGDESFPHIYPQIATGYSRTLPEVSRQQIKETPANGSLYGRHRMLTDTQIWIDRQPPRRDAGSAR